MPEEEHDVESLADRERNSDPSTVYDDLDSLPGWWREAVEEFADYGLRPYRPSRFEDGEIVREFVETVEKEYDVSVELKAINPEHDGEWSVFVDGEVTAAIPHRRKVDGYTEYGITSEEPRYSRTRMRRAWRLSLATEGTPSALRGLDRSKYSPEGRRDGSTATVCSD